VSKIVREWNADKVLAEVSGRVLSGMDNACQFAAERAKGHAPKRTGTLAEEIDYEVVPERNKVVGYVGVKRGEIGAVNQGKAFYGYFHELGTSKMRAHPFLRPAVFGNGDEIVKRIQGG